MLIQVQRNSRDEFPINFWSHPDPGIQIQIRMTGIRRLRCRSALSKCCCSRISWIN